MNFWILKCNPDYYRLDERLADPEPHITWKISRYRKEVTADDFAFIWQTGPCRGIRATMLIDSAPQDMLEIPSEQKYGTRPDTCLDCRVYGTLLRRDLNLPAGHLKQVPGLESLPVFHGFQQTTVFKLTSEQARLLLGLIGKVM